MTKAEEYQRNLMLELLSSDQSIEDWIYDVLSDGDAEMILMLIDEHRGLPTLVIGG